MTFIDLRIKVKTLFIYLQNNLPSNNKGIDCFTQCIMFDTTLRWHFSFNDIRTNLLHFKYIVNGLFMLDRKSKIKKTSIYMAKIKAILKWEPTDGKWGIGRKKLCIFNECTVSCISLKDAQRLRLRIIPL